MMKTRTKLLLPLMLLCIAVFALALTASAETITGECGENLTWTLDTNTGVLEIAGSGKMENWFYPRFAPWNSYRFTVRTVTISSGAKNVGDSAFYGFTNLESIVIPDSVTSIGDWAFGDCFCLTDVKLPNGVTSIGDRAFINCRNLAYISIPDSVVAISELTFDGCPAILVATRGSYAYSYARQYNLPYKINDGEANDIVASGKCGDSLIWQLDSAGTLVISGEGEMWDSDTIYDNENPLWYAYATRVRAITISKDVTHIETETFQNCDSLSSIEVDAKNSNYASKDGVLFNKAMTALLKVPCGTYNSYMVPSGVTDIGDSAFLGCGLTRIEIPYTVKQVGTYAFAAYNLEEIVVDTNNPSFTSKSGALFSKDMTTLIRVPRMTGTYTIPTGVKSIRKGAFGGCQELLKIFMPDSVTTVEDNAFGYCSALQTITLSAELTEIGFWLFEGCSSLQSIIIPEQVSKIQEGSFSGCEKLKQISIMNADCEIFDHSETISESATIYGFAGSTAEAYAKKYNRAFAQIGHTHIYAEDYTVDVPANCTAPGSKSHHCTRCDAKTDITEIPKTAHTYVDGICKDCGKVKPPFIPGVVTGEGEKPAKKDLLRLQKYLAGWDVEIDEAAADCNGDGKITKADLLRLQKYLAGWDVTLGK